MKLPFAWIVVAIAVLGVGIAGPAGCRHTPAAPATAADPAAVPPAGQLTETFDNGLRVVVQENHTAPVAALRLYVKTGSMYEQEYLGAGISHIFEHLIHGGSTKNQTEAQIKERLERLGNATNAYTTKDHTCYHLTTAADQLGEAIDLIADWMINCNFPKAEFDRELGVVLEELRKGKEEPWRVLSQTFDETFFLQHPARLPVIGYEEQVRRLTHGDIVTYYQRWYAPNNMTVVAVGDFNAAAMMAKLRQAFGPFERRTPPLVTLPEEPAQQGRRDRVLTREGLGGAYFRFGFHTVALQHEDMYPLDVLSYVLSHGRSSRLVRVVQEEKRLVSSIGSYSDTPSYGGGCLGVYGECAPEQLDAAMAAALAELYRCRDELIPADELEKAKRQKLADDILGKQTAEDEAESLGPNLMSTGNPNFDQLYLTRIRAVTAAQVRDVARRYCRDDLLTTVVLRPPAAPATAGATTTAASGATPLRQVTLPNGLRLLVKRNPNVPLVNVQLVFLGGVRLEPAEHAGISRITAELLTRGSARYSAAAIAATFDRLGGSLGPTSGNNSFGLSLEVLKEDFPTALALFTDLVRAPSFPADELDTVKAMTLDELARQNDNWQGELGNKFRELYFTTHPYGRNPLGKVETVSALTPAAARQFYEANAVPERGVLTIFGDLDPDATIAAATAALGDFRRAGQPLPTFAPQAARTRDDVQTLTVRRNLAAVMIGYPGATVRSGADLYALTVLDAVLSGIGFPGGRLQEHLRGGQQDLVYLVHAFNFIGLEPGYFGITAASSPAKMDKVIEIILADVAALRDQPVPAAELEKAKTVCLVMEKLGRQTNHDLALQAALDELYGLGAEHSAKYEAGIKAVTAADVQRVARQYLTHHVLLRTGPPAAPAKPAVPATPAPPPAKP